MLQQQTERSSLCWCGHHSKSVQQQLKLRSVSQRQLATRQTAAFSTTGRISEGVTVSVEQPFCPPGSLPFLGHLFQLDINRFYLSAEAWFKRHKKRSLKVQLLGLEALHFRHPDDCLAILDTQSDSFVKVPGIRRLDKLLGNGLVSQADKAEHQRMRELMKPAFQANTTNALLPVIRMVGKQLCETLSASQGQPVDVQYLTKCASLDIIGLTSFKHSFGALSIAQGRGADGQIDVVKQLAQAQLGIRWLSMDLNMPDYLLPGYRQYVHCCDDIDGVIDSVIDTRMHSSSLGSDVDALAFLLRSHQSCGFPSLQQIRSEVKTLLFAGMDTASSTLGFAMLLLAQNPSSYKRAQQEVDSVLGRRQSFSEVTAGDIQALPFLTACIKETLRLYPAAPFTGRIAVNDVVIHGQHIRRGALCFLDHYSIHLNEEFWPRYQDWVPERWLPGGEDFAAKHRHSWVPFGLGSRACIGRNLAMLELQTLLAFVLHSNNFSIATGYDLVTQVGVTLSAENGILLNMHTRK